MTQEHERAAGAWQAEAETLSDLLRLTGSAATALRELLEGLQVHTDRMRSNLDITGGLLMTESVVTALTPSLGRAKAQEIVEDAARRVMDEGVSLKEALPDVDDSALAPESYLGAASELIDRALAAHRGSA
jgi:3-carboxy-cis,cis-muconate cycloisomerase